LTGSSNPVLSYQDVTKANKLIMDIISITAGGEAGNVYVSSFLIFFHPFS
jgi:hypothetical protein